ncbi:hypothetical protein [Cedecea sp. NFIX57]|uniref:hypothetical protein n=1 Tax=Cedecea sp. NFIX57 TaxID=1566286 RepID=UPI000A0B0B5C|nr:hypothetical protein [Cedecea sp. NFIX57]SMG37121.1 hypothetical protein SAMN03159353_1008147 [Cedecea sp. NFIX57]
MGDEKFTECEEVHKVLGRLVVVLIKSERPVTADNIRLLLHSYMSLNDDAHLAKLYGMVKKVVG